MTQSRNYNYKDIDMLLASQIVIKSLKDNLAELAMIRTNWNDEYVSALTAKVDGAIENSLSIDKKMELRNATRTLSQLEAPAKRYLSFIKTQIEVDFGNEAQTLLTTLGFSKFINGVQNGDQESLIQLLFAFKKNMTESIKQSIVEKGTTPQLIDQIIAYANQIKDANVSQESLKEISKQTTDENITLFNEIYNDVIGICKIAANYYQHDLLLKDSFTFSKVVANMGATKRVGNKGEEPME